MTIPEEIEQLKIKLEQTVDEREQAEVLLEILKKYTSINSTESQPYIDHLLQLAEKFEEPLYKAWAFYHLAISNRNTGKYNPSLNFTQRALDLFQQQGDQHGMASCYNNSGLVYRHQGNTPEALKNHFAGLTLREEIKDKKGTASSLNNIAAIYEDQGNYPEAQKSYFASLKLLEELGDKNSIATLLMNIGLLYSKQGNYPEALKNHFVALKLKEEIGDKSGIAILNINLGSVYQRQGNYQEALKKYFVALKSFEEAGEKSNVAMGYGNIGNGYYGQGNYPEALKNYFTALRLSKEIGDKFSIAALYSNIGAVYEKQGSYLEALKNELLAIELLDQTGHKTYIMETALSLTNLYKAMNDFENALKYYEKYHEVEKEMLGEESTKQLNNLSFMHNLEQKEKDLEIEQLRNVELKKERDRSEALLLNILPAEVAEELKNKGSADAKLFDEVTVFFSDFKAFTTISERLTPQGLVDELNLCFSAFDEIMGRYNIEKIKTVGDAYLAVSGLPQSNPNHATDVINAALEVNRFIAQRIKERGSNADGLGEVRIGIHSGSVVAGIVGVKKFAYDIWGDTVNTAARMEQSGEAGKVNISEATYELVKDQFTCEYRGEIEAKNKGKMKMYFVEKPS